jgi:hypothetical protein
MIHAAIRLSLPLLFLLMIRSLALPAQEIPGPFLEPADGLLLFEENQGQWAEDILFQCRLPEMVVRVTEEGLSTALFRKVAEERPDKLHTELQLAVWEAQVWNRRFQGSSPPSAVSARNPSRAYTNYLIGSDSGRWARGVRSFAELWMENLYPGIHLRYYGSGGGQLKYDLIAEPGADPSQVLLALEGIEALRARPDGSLEVRIGLDSLLDQKPLAYQWAEGKRRYLPIEYALKSESSFGFHFPEGYDPRLPLVIDPITLTWGSFFHHSTSDDYLMAIERDADGFIYMTGYTQSLAFPLTPGVYQSAAGGQMDGFVAKMDPSGSSSIFATYIGGSQWDLPYGIGVDDAGQVYVTGFGASSDFPTSASSAQPSSKGGLCEAFLACLSPDGSTLVYSTYAGGSDRDYLHDLHVTPSGEAYVAGHSISADISLTHSGMAQPGGGHAIVFKYLPGGQIAYASALGGSGADIAYCLDVSPSGEAVVGGSSTSSDFPSSALAYKSAPSYSPWGFPEEGFVFRLSSGGDSLRFATYLGGSDLDEVHGLDLGPDGSIYLSGHTYSTDLPVSPGAWASGSSAGLGSGDAFWARLSANGSSLLAASYLGGSGIELCLSIRATAGGEALLLGATQSPNFPLMGSTASYQAQYDVFIAAFSADASVLLESTLLGGMQNDYPRSNGSLHESGYELALGLTSHSPAMPTTAGSFQPSKLNGTEDAPWVGVADWGYVLAAGSACEAAYNPGTGRVEVAGGAEGSTLQRYDPQRSLWLDLPAALSSGWAEDPASAALDAGAYYYRFRQEGPQGPSYGRSCSAIIPARPLGDLSVSPNPAQAQAELRCELAEGQHGVLKAFSVSSACLMREEVGPGRTQRLLDVSKWPAGLYTLSLESPGFPPIIRRLQIAPR